MASGGEIARVMLSLKAMISGAVKLPTIIFDEIDTGVSGSIAEKDGAYHAGNGGTQPTSHQHHPSAPNRGSRQHALQKFTRKTTRRVPAAISSKLDEKKDAWRKIAHMLSGTTLTDAAINNAKELLNQIL